MYNIDTTTSLQLKGTGVVYEPFILSHCVRQMFYLSWLPLLTSDWHTGDILYQFIKTWFHLHVVYIGLFVIFG